MGDHKHAFDLVCAGIMAGANALCYSTLELLPIAIQIGTLVLTALSIFWFMVRIYDRFVLRRSKQKSD